MSANPFGLAFLFFLIIEYIEVIFLSRLFKTDGIRGRYGVDVTLDLAYKVGYSLKLLNNSKLVIGYDTRFSSEKLRDYIISGAKFNGINILDLGLSTTPRVEYYSKKYSSLGIMITASHNKYYDNGIKIFKNGVKLKKEEELLIEKGIINFFDSYEKYIIDNINLIEDNVCLDLDNGGACYLKNFINKSNIHLINVNYDGKNINDKCGSLYPEVLKDEIIKNGYDYGFAFDGDADRVIAVDGFGNVLDGDYLAYIIVSFYKYKSVVLSKMCNQGVIEAFKKKGVLVYLADSGDKNILELMNKYNVMVGSEASGHIIYRKYGSSGDGVLNATLIMNILKEDSKSLTDYYNEINLYPAELRNYDVEIRKEDINDLYKKINELYPTVISYIRLSGTEGVLRVYLQDVNHSILEDCFIMVEDELCKL